MYSILHFSWLLLYFGCDPDPQRLVDTNKEWVVAKLQKFRQSCLDARKRNDVPNLLPTTLELVHQAGYLSQFDEPSNLMILGVEFCSPPQSLPPWWKFMPNNDYTMDNLITMFDVKMKDKKTTGKQSAYFADRNAKHLPYSIKEFQPIEYVAFYKVKNFSPPSVDTQKNKLTKASIQGSIYLYRLADQNLIQAASFQAVSSEKITYDSKRFATIDHKYKDTEQVIYQETVDLGDTPSRAKRAAESDFSNNLKKALRDAIGYRPAKNR